jgi:hypothetical protein
MKFFLPAVALTAALALPAQAADVKVQVSNGRITLQARDATVREILAEWARVGQVKIVNAEQVMGIPVTLDLQNVPEAEALNTLLRSVSGYMAAPKLQAAQASSIYDRIVIMAAPRSAAIASASSSPTQPTQFQQFRGLPGGMPNPTMLDDQDEPAGPPPTYPGMPPGFNAQRGMMPNQPQQPQNTPGVGTIPQGAPGTVSPMPTQAITPGQQIVAPGTGAPGSITPAQPPKKPGGPGGPGGEIDR